MVLVSSLPFSNFVLPEEQRPGSDTFAGDKDFPLIDLSSSCSDGSFAALVDGAAREYGFFQILNHGAEAAVERMRDMTKTMMLELPQDRKEALKAPEGSRIGFAAGGYEVPFWHEGFQIPDDPELIHAFSDKMWPDSPSSARNFRETVGDYTLAVRSIGTKILEAFAAALGAKDPDALSSLTKKEISNFRVNHYPACAQPSLTLGMPPHYDRQIITLLHQDEVGGLQVFYKGEWFGVKPRTDVLILIVGDALQALSNKNYSSVRHRVVANSAMPRISMAYFISPRRDIVIAPLQEVVDEDHPAIYRPFTANEMLGQANAVRMSGYHIDRSYLDHFKVQA